MVTLSLLSIFVVSAVAYDNGSPHSKLPPLGWSSWVSLGPDWPGPKANAPVFDFCDESSVKASIDAFMEVGLYDAGYRHFHLDDCWADVERNASGFLQAERDHFPNGMKPVVDYAHSKGLTFGLYTCAGTYTCVGKRPGSKDHWTQDAQVFAEWGVDWVKMDWCSTSGMVPEDTYPKMSSALNKTGRHIHFNMCEWGKDAPWTWGPKVAQSWRATGDHTGNWDSTKDIIKQRTAIPAEHGGAPYAWNDMDMLETGNYKQAAHANGRVGTMTDTEYKTEFSMWAIFASPMVVTTPILNCSQTDQISGKFTPGKCVPSITPLQKEILLNKEVLAINQDVTPAGRLLSDSAAGERAQVGASDWSTYPDPAIECRVLHQTGQAPCIKGQSFSCNTYPKKNTHFVWTSKSCEGVFQCQDARVSCGSHEDREFHKCDCPNETLGSSPAALVYGRNLTDGSVAVALYNPADSTASGEFDFALLGWPHGTTASARDLWAHKDLGDFTGSFMTNPATTVEAHGTVVLRLTPKKVEELVV